MEINWKKAQESEKKFWKSIYVEKGKDVASYMPVTDAAALAFSGKTLQRFRHDMNTIRGMVVADVGCGPYGLIRGFQVYAKRAGNPPKKIYGVDSLMDTYLEFGTLATEPYIEYITAKAESIPLEDGSCDYVYCTNVIDHVEHPGKVLEECRRITKTTGEVCFAVHTINYPFNLLGPLLFLIDKNHPYHFNEKYITRLAQRYFCNVTLTKNVTIFEDHPEFTLANVFQSGDKLRNLKRWLSTFLISTCYFKCSS